MEFNGYFTTFNFFNFDYTLRFEAGKSLFLYLPNKKIIFCTSPLLINITFISNNYNRFTRQL